MVTRIENIPNKYTVYMHITPSNKRYIVITCQDVQQRCIDDGQVFESMTAAGKEYGINKTLICRGLQWKE